jgi:hypothetical protein
MQEFLSRDANFFCLRRKLVLRYRRGMMQTPAQIIDYIGADRLRLALEVTPTRIRQARLEPQLPASWFATCERLTRRKLPRELFAFKGAEA